MQTFRIILDVISLIAGVGVSVLTYYTFYLRFFSKKIECLGCSSDFGFNGCSISINVENCSLRTLSIEEVKIVYDNQYIMTVKKFEEPFILEPFRTYKIKGDNFTSLTPVCFEELVPLRNKYLVIETSNGKLLTIKFRGKIYKNKELIPVKVHVEKFNNLVVAECVRYILCYNHKTVFITDTGFMSESVVNRVHEIPKEIVSSKSEVQRFFSDIFDPLKISFGLKERNKV